MKSTSSISKMLNQKIECINPEELGKYLIESEFGICRRFSSGEWKEEDADAELQRLHQEVRDAADNLSIYQYLKFREAYHINAENELVSSNLQDLIRCYDMIEHLLHKCIDYRRLFLSSPHDELIPIYQEMLSEYQQRRADILSSSFWKEHHPPAAEVLS